MFKNIELAQRNGQSATISKGNWFLYDCISFLNIIPIVGSIAALIIYIVIAASAQTAPSLRNRCIVDLIWAVVALVVIGIVIAVFGAVIVAAISSASGDASSLSELSYYSDPSYYGYY